MYCSLYDKHENDDENDEYYNNCKDQLKHKNSASLASWDNTDD